ncbi:hypothetical protein RBU61_16995 [Tissierella sp. MB52-C2]|uniref:hypothetical protein n=1 Tax=Tissierella sp. MB52-C2 TaxID=3070999 RepID=UPI00280C2384|nr:hypothetical protein [Tissierella sp. MB52-C2]WMM24608.1 hypothetical protein RBU61_16995 [Tissierella sp. MB52-C2]
MDDIVKKIISIDKDAVNIKLKTEEIMNQRERQLKENLQELEKRYMEEGRIEGEDIYKKIIKESEEEIERLEYKDSKILKDIENSYKENKKRLVEDLWVGLFRMEE